MMKVIFCYYKAIKECDKQISEMRNSVAFMKKHMKELEAVYEGEIEKLQDEKISAEFKANTRIQQLEDELKSKKSEIYKLKKKAVEFAECISDTKKTNKTFEKMPENELENDLKILKTQENESGWKSIETFCEKPNKSMGQNRENLEENDDVLLGKSPDLEMGQEKRTNELKKEIEGLDKDIEELQKGFFKQDENECE